MFHVKHASAPVVTTNLGFGLYIHWPFCQSKCPYCDFNSHVSERIDQVRWRNAYLAEIERLGLETAGRIVNTIYFGGGTPSLMDPELVHAILEKISRTWRQSNDVEITIEANPSSVEAARFAAYRHAGVNRVSIGVQALNSGDLKRLGRMHSVAEAMSAIEIGSSVFGRVNFDLIYARQDQTLAAWRSELQTALGFGTSHLSLYQLTVEEGTVFQQRSARGLLSGLPGEDLAADMFDLTQDLCAAAGMPSYEVSNHARLGQESRHNLIYWRGGDYIGLGPGAHGRITSDTGRLATEAIKLPASWMESVEKRGTGEIPRAILTGQEAGAEYLMMGLRIKEGVSLSRYFILTGHNLDLRQISDLANLGLLTVGPDRICVTNDGMLVLNAILRAILVR